MFSRKFTVDVGSMKTGRPVEIHEEGGNYMYNQLIIKSSLRYVADLVATIHSLHKHRISFEIVMCCVGMRY